MCMCMYTCASADACETREHEFTDLLVSMTAEGTFPRRRVNAESRFGFPRRRGAKATMLAAPPCHPPSDTPTVVRKVSFAWPLQQVREFEVHAHL